MALMKLIVSQEKTQSMKKALQFFSNVFKARFSEIK